MLKRLSYNWLDGSTEKRHEVLNRGKRLSSFLIVETSHEDVMESLR
jgi:hypothetical protein